MDNSLENIRDQFEKWYSKRFSGGKLANMPMRVNGEYVSVQQEIAWQSWREAANEIKHLRGLAGESSSSGSQNSDS